MSWVLTREVCTAGSQHSRGESLWQPGCLGQLRHKVVAPAAKQFSDGQTLVIKKMLGRIKLLERLPKRAVCLFYPQVVWNLCCSTVLGVDGHKATIVGTGLQQHAIEQHTANIRCLVRHVARHQLLKVTLRLAMQGHMLCERIKPNIDKLPKTSWNVARYLAGISGTMRQLLWCETENRLSKVCFNNGLCNQASCCTHHRREVVVLVASSCTAQIPWSQSLSQWSVDVPSLDHRTLRSRWPGPCPVCQCNILVCFKNSRFQIWQPVEYDLKLIWQCQSTVSLCQMPCS